MDDNRKENLTCNKELSRKIVDNLKTAYQKLLSIKRTCTYSYFHNGFSEFITSKLSQYTHLNSTKFAQIHEYYEFN